VRTPTEYAAGHIDNSVNIPLNHLDERLAELPPGRPVAVLCAGGYRSSIAASLMQRRGIDTLVELAGGMAAWQAAQATS
jgi:rhodanese-related sulfurtransferase